MLFKNGRSNRSLPVNNSSSSVCSIAQRLIGSNGDTWNERLHVPDPERGLRHKSTKAPSESLVHL
nr:MAG TPA: hypothetical protein [Caudoviricetes sp.]